MNALKFVGACLVVFPAAWMLGTGISYLFEFIDKKVPKMWLFGFFLMALGSLIIKICELQPQ